MARSRNIKPGLFKNEVLGVADPIYTILFQGLWVLADREGRLEDRPMRIKAETLNAKTRNVSDKKDMRQEAGAEPCLFGWHLIDPKARTSAITEGEIDAMTLHQAGNPGGVARQEATCPAVRQGWGAGSLPPRRCASLHSAPTLHGGSCMNVERAYRGILRSLKRTNFSVPVLQVQDTAHRFNVIGNTYSPHPGRQRGWSGQRWPRRAQAR